MSAKKKGVSKAAAAATASGVAKDEAKATASLFGSDGNRDDYLALVAAIPAGLLGSPDMHIAGGDASYGELGWLADRATSNNVRARWLETSRIAAGPSRSHAAIIIGAPAAAAHAQRRPTDLSAMPYPAA